MTEPVQLKRLAFISEFTTAISMLVTGNRRMLSRGRAGDDSVRLINPKGLNLILDAVFRKLAGMDLVDSEVVEVKTSSGH